MGSIFIFLILTISYNPIIEATNMESIAEFNNQNQINRKIFANKYPEIYNQLVKKDCNCYYYDIGNTLFCMILLLMIITLALIPAIGWIILIELDFGTFYSENCL